MILFRITKTSPPTERDFTSIWDLDPGRRPKSLSGAELKREEDSLKALSMERTMEAAMKVALKYPQLGDYISKVAVPDSASIEWDEDHADLSGFEPQTALAWVSSTVAVRRKAD